MDISLVPRIEPSIREFQIKCGETKKPLRLFLSFSFFTRDKFYYLSSVRAISLSPRRRSLKLYTGNVKKAIKRAISRQKTFALSYRLKAVKPDFPALDVFGTLARTEISNVKIFCEQKTTGRTFCHTHTHTHTLYSDTHFTHFSLSTHLTVTRTLTVAHRGKIKAPIVQSHSLFMCK